MAKGRDPFDTRAEVTYGVAEAVAEGVRRVTCRNPSAYTFTGTQSYLVGTGDVALIDPGPDDPAHLQALMAALGPEERISHILITHSHRDHSPGAAVLARETGAEVHAFGAHGSGLSPTMQILVESGAEIGGGEGGDTSFVPDRALADGDSVEGADWRLSALHTPGHMSNHLSFVLEGTGVVFTGDTVMGFATTLVSPPDGDMAAFMASLARLAARPDDRLYLPGHGHAVTDPQGMVHHQIGHRRQRFEQILQGLAAGPRNAAALTREIYTEINPSLLPAAQRNVLASLIGLMDEGRVACQGTLSVNAEFSLP